MEDSPSNDLDPDNINEHINIVESSNIFGYEEGSTSPVRFLRVEVRNLEPTVRSIARIIADTSWTSGLLDDTVKASFLACATPTIKKLSQDLVNAIDNNATNSIGEYVVSVVARRAIQNAYSYYALPLAEVIKEKVSGNPGFDFHHVNSGFILLFGEAKYQTGRNAHNSAFKQIIDFIEKNKDLKEIAILSPFLQEKTKQHVLAGNKGYSAAFSTAGKDFDSDKLIATIVKNTHFNELCKHEEVLVVAIDIV